MTITLTREEAQQVLDALELANGSMTADDVVLYTNEEIETLRARLSEPEPEPVKLRRGDILRCIETNELCTVWATSTTGKTLVKWKANDFGSYTAEQIGDLFWVEPKPEPEPVAWNIKHNRPPLSSDNPHEVVAVIKREWQGLTDEEIEAGFMANTCCDDLVVYEHVASAIEAKLKEKNT